MNATIYLVIRARKIHSLWSYSTSKTYKKKPPVAANEVVVQMNVDIPNSLFETPTLQASITIPDMPGGPVIDVEMTDNIAAIIKEQMGIKMEIVLPESEE